jgi:DNA-binding Xre family transcriptional regulator
MFKYDKLFKLFEDRGINSYTVRKLNLMSGRAYQAVRDGTADLSLKAVGTLCEYFECQPSDLIEYVPDERAS